ncbi:MAG: endonuclease III domain-containing protein [Verrucomicrobiota bacterium]
MTALYHELLDLYGPQGWWPLLKHNGANPTKTGSHRGYHPGQYGLPETSAGRFEVAVGAVLTQNTAWPNVEKALAGLLALEALTPQAILAANEDDLRRAIRPAGYYNIKAKKLRCLSEFIVAHRSSHGDTPPEREALLGVWGIGPETADSIRLYAYHCPEMVVDTYTRRILVARKVCEPDISYSELKRICISAIPATVPDYQEFHALMVEHGKHLSAR